MITELLFEVEYNEAVQLARSCHIITHIFLVFFLLIWNLSSCLFIDRAECCNQNNVRICFFFHVAKKIESK